MRVRLTIFAAFISMASAALWPASAQVSDNAPSATMLLAQGQPQAAYFVAIEQAERADASAADYVLAGKAAFAHVKSAPLLRKKRWAKRGRDAYQAALTVDPNNSDALLGLATFALRAPSGLAGGTQAYTDYADRLSASAPDHATWLTARTHKNANDYGAALDAFESILGQLDSERLFFEFAGTAKKAKDPARAYAALESISSRHGCVDYLRATLAEQADASSEDILAHYMTFFQSGVRHCDRRDVGLTAAIAALDLADRLERFDAVAAIAAIKARLEQAPATQQEIQDIAS